MLSPGDKAPNLDLVDQHGDTVKLSSFTGRNVCLYFYPKADTPGCTTQSCLLRDLLAEHPTELGATAVIGISPDTVARQARFDTKYALGFPLLADTDHRMAEAYGVWKEKSLYGKKYMGIERSAFLIDGTGRVARAWYRISPKDTPAKLLEALTP